MQAKILQKWYYGPVVSLSDWQETRVYFRWQSIPELSDLPPDQSERLWREARRERLNAGDLLRVGCLLGMYAVLALICMWLPRVVHSVWLLALLFPGLAILWGFLSGAILIQKYRPIVRQLRDHGE